MLISFSNLKMKYDMNIKGIIHIGAHYGEEIVDYIYAVPLPPSFSDCIAWWTGSSWEWWTV